jgi:hypothetical protein
MKKHVVEGAIHGPWCVIGLVHHLIHPPQNYNLYQSWGLGMSMEFVSKV